MSSNEMAPYGTKPGSEKVSSLDSDIDDQKHHEILEHREILARILRDEREVPMPPPRSKQRSESRFEDFREAIYDSIQRIWGRTAATDTHTALVPASSISGRALAIVVIIMTFLASITAGSVELISAASSGWSADIAREMTIQVRPASSRDLEADVKAAAAIAQTTAGIAEVRIYTKAESERLLEPWLGTALPFEQLPVPRIITLKLVGGSSILPAGLLTDIRKRLAVEVPSAALDDHRQWSSRLATMANALVLIGFFILMLVLCATGLAIAFATRGAMAGTREIVNVLHLVGAEDRFIADEFQRHFLKLGARSGVLGGVLASLVFFVAGSVGQAWRATPEGDEVEALFGTFGLGIKGYAAICVIILLVAGITAIVTRATVYRNLRGLD